MRTGQITLPRREPERTTLISIRTGEFGPLERVLELATEKFDELTSAENNSNLPQDVDRGAINELVAQTYLNFYMRH